MSAVHSVAHVIDFADGQKIISPHAFKDSEGAVLSLAAKLHQNLSAILSDGQIVVGQDRLPVTHFLAALGIRSISVTTGTIQVLGDIQLAAAPKIVLAH